MATSEEDRNAALVLLGGFARTNKAGLPRWSYFAEGSEGDHLSRQAIARLLRSDLPVDPRIRAALANLFDPTSSVDRTITFKFRPSHRRRDHVRDTHIAYAVALAVKNGTGVENAIGEAAQRYSLSESAVEKIWQRYQRASGLSEFTMSAKK